MANHDDTIPVDSPHEADTEPTPVVPRGLKAPPATTTPVTPLRPSASSEATDPDLVTEIKSGEQTAPLQALLRASELPPSPAKGSPVLALAKPKRSESDQRFVQRKIRLPTESEIRDAVESVPTESVPIVAPGDAAEDPDETGEDMPRDPSLGG